MKYVIVIPDGLADQRLDELGKMTPLEAAETPNIDWLGANGRLGTVAYSDKRHPVGRAQALLTLLGYDMRRTPIGSAALEALGAGLDDAATDHFYHCNLVTVTDRVLIDAAAGRISDSEAQAVVALLNEHLAPGRLTFHYGRQHRHLMNTPEALDVQTTCPYEVQGKSIRRGRVRGTDAERLQEIMDLAAAALADHEINAIRRELGESPITGVWLWGEGPLTPLPSFADRTGLSGAMVSLDPLAVGVARHIGWDVVDIDAQDHYTDAAMAALAGSAVEAVDTYDVVCIHTAWPDAAALAGDLRGKLEATESLDRHVIGDLLRRLRKVEPSWRLLIAPAQTTGAVSRQRTAAPAPFVLTGQGVESVLHKPFYEATAQAADLQIKRAWELMEFVLTVR